MGIFTKSVVNCCLVLLRLLRQNVARLAFPRNPYHVFAVAGVVVAIVVMLGLTSWGCSTKGSTNIRGEGLKTGAKTEITLQDISSSGGTITVNKAGDPLDGLKLEVPPGAYEKTRSFKVSSAPVISHGLGPDITAISPLISIENGGDYAEQPMLLTIPIKDNLEGFPMAFYYEESTGRFEGMQPVSKTPDSLTVATRHFSDAVVFRYKESIIQEALAKGVESEFKFGQDNWKLPNKGTFLSPGGNCSGISVSSIWYFEEKVLKGNANTPHLYGLYEHNGNPGLPGLDWEDSAQALKLVSTIQKDFADNKQKILVGAKYSDSDTLKAVASNMLTMKQDNWPCSPSFISLVNPTDDYAHAMVAYKADSTGIYVADPNSPGTPQKIKFENGKLLPYKFGSDEYPIIRYLSVHFLIKWDLVAQRWEELKAGNIGNNYYPGYVLKYQDDASGDWRLLTENKKLSQSKIWIRPFPDGPIAAQQPLLEMDADIYRDNQWLEKKEAIFTQLKPGNNHLGIMVLAGTGSGSDKKWIDFKWLNVTYESVPIAPSPDTKSERRTQTVYWEGTQNISQQYTYYVLNGIEYKDGTETSYLSDGSKQFINNWKDGKMDGLQQLYNPDGSLAKEWMEKNGQQDGFEKHYYWPSGKLQEEWLYQDDKVVPGSHKAYDENGNLLPDK
jgi:hypothetical protein